MKSILIILVFLLFGCTDSEYYKVRFDNIGYLKTGDEVRLNDQLVGEVKNLEMDDEWKILATIWIGRGIKLTKGSTFTIRSGLEGRFVEVELSNDQELMNADELQIGQLQRDTAQAFKVTKLDSLLKNDPQFHIVDTLLKLALPEFRKRIHEESDTVN